MTKVVP